METIITAERYHDISCGHRVVGHENKCRFLHGHNYRITFTLGTHQGLDTLGRVLDFGVMKSLLCAWLEENWDHKMLLWEKDPFLEEERDLVLAKQLGVVRVPFNPTAENMAQHLLEHVGPTLLWEHSGLALVKVRVEETRKCSAVARL